MEKFKSSFDNVIALYRKMAISNSSILENTDRFYFMAIDTKSNAIILSFEWSKYLARIFAICKNDLFLCTSYLFFCIGNKSTLMLVIN